MNIAFLAHDKKKELMVQFCTAYKSVLMKHNLLATATTGRLIADNTGLPITLLLSHKQGGHQQINARIAYNEIDLVLLFTDPNTTDPWDDSQGIMGNHSYLVYLLASFRSIRFPFRMAMTNASGNLAAISFFLLLASANVLYAPTVNFTVFPS